MFPYLTFMTFFPLVGAILIFLLPRGKEHWVKWTALIATIPPLIAAVVLYFLFDRTEGSMQFVEGPLNWIPTFHIHYYMGIDGVSVSMVLLTTLISFICIPASWGINKQVKGYFSLFLLLETGMMGVFCALDFFL
ncbi:MAG: NADH-quinone oxidoreductase subunit M, partial [Deltaproteobacteria bacterium]|nr:NADH-quinone oxidoreductase subunit M [Deltaproteobacteria bacterium]